MRKILGIPAGNHATAYHRIIQPLQALVREAQVDFLSENQEKQYEQCDTIFAQCLFSPSAYQFYRQLVRKGKRLVLDYDDNYFDIPENSPEKMAIIDRKTNQIEAFNQDRVIYWVKAFLRLADTVIVPTDYLKEIYQPFCSKVVVVPNCVSLDMQRDISKKPHDRPRILWSGSASHLPDLSELAKPLAALAKQGLEIHLQGPIDFKKIFRDLEFIEHPSVEFGDYLNLIQSIDADIALLPLNDNKFNAGKSNLKFLQMTLMESVCVASNVGPYRNSIQAGVTGLLVNTADDWVSAVNSCLNPSLKKNLLDNAFQFVKDSSLVEHHLHKWRHALLE